MFKRLVKEFNKSCHLTYTYFVTKLKSIIIPTALVTAKNKNGTT